MKATLNDRGAYINCKITEIEKDATHKIYIKTANCDDGYRCQIYWDWDKWSTHRTIMHDDQAHATEREAISHALAKQAKWLVQIHGTKRYVDLVTLLHQALEEYNQLDLFEL